MDQNIVLIVSAITLALLVIAIIRLLTLAKCVNRLADQIPGTSMTAKELAAELGGSIESSFQKFMPQPEKVSGAITSAVETSVKAALANVENLHKKLLDAQDAVLDKWAAHEKNTTSGLGAISKALDESSRQFAAGLTGGSQKMQASFDGGSKKLEAAMKEHGEKTAKASADLSAQLDKIAAIGKDIEKLLHVQQATEGTIKAVTTTDEFKKTLEALRTHLEASDKLLREVAKPRTIRLVEQE